MANARLSQNLRGVIEWLYKDGGRMPYIETSFGGDPKSSWRNAERVFRTVAQLLNVQGAIVN